MAARAVVGASDLADVGFHALLPQAFGITLSPDCKHNDRLGDDVRPGISPADQVELAKRTLKRGADERDLVCSECRTLEKPSERHEMAAQ